MIGRRFIALASLSAGLILTGQQADASPITIKLDLAGIGSDANVTNFAFGLSGAYAHVGGGWQVQTLAASDFTVELPEDGTFTPALGSGLN